MPSTTLCERLLRGFSSGEGGSNTSEGALLLNEDGVLRRSLKIRPLRILAVTSSTPPRSPLDLNDEIEELDEDRELLSCMRLCHSFRATTKSSKKETNIPNIASGEGATPLTTGGSP